MTIKLREVLTKELERRSLSINNVAKSCGISPSVLHGWVNGTLPSAKNLHHIKNLANYLGLSISKILFDTDNAPSPSHLILFSSTFRDGGAQYKLTIEKIKE